MRGALVLAGAGLALALWACGGSLPHPRYVAQPTSALEPVPMGPPPARVEFIPPSPASGAVWIDGEWVYRRGRWAWVLGRWVVPEPGMAFSPWVTVRGANGDVFHASGVWRDKDGKAVEGPRALALATAQAGPVVDAEGVIETTGRTMRANMLSSDAGARDGATAGDADRPGEADGGPHVESDGSAAFGGGADAAVDGAGKDASEDAAPAPPPSTP